VAGKVDLYDSAYGNYAADAYRQVRLETYGEGLGADLGQTSWVTAEESREIPRLLELTADSAVLEVGCGSGGYALYLAQTAHAAQTADVAQTADAAQSAGADAGGCRIVGLDVNASGVSNANQLAAARGLEGRARFEERDASKKLPFEEGSFDAVFANDVLCHLPGRGAVLAEMFRVLKPGGRMLFSDALVVGGLISHEEIATRSSIGFYVYSPPGENERLMERAGFRGVKAMDTTENAAQIAQRWHGAREKRREALVAAEGEPNFGGLQRFLRAVQVLTEERRLLRYLYVGRKEF
jgi:SAM-dependent methyltransferase